MPALFADAAAAGLAQVLGGIVTFGGSVRSVDTLAVVRDADYAQEVYSTLGMWSAVNVALLIAGYVAAGALRDTFPKSNRWELADLIGSTPVFAALAAMALSCANDLGNSGHDRWLGRSDLAFHLICCYVARQVVSFPLVYCSGFKPPDMARTSRPALPALPPAPTTDSSGSSRGC